MLPGQAKNGPQEPCWSAYSVPSAANARSTTVVRPLAYTLVVPSGAMRWMRANPVGNGTPVSSETYSAPSGPCATAVATGSTNGGPIGSGFGREPRTANVEMLPFAAT